MERCPTRPSETRRSVAERRRALVVCAHLRRDRSKRASRDFLQPITGLHIGSLIDPERFDVELYHEDWHGPYDTSRPARFDLVFLTGLHADFDRMRQLSFHFRRAGAVVVAGGSICTLFPEFAARFFDAVCAGGVDSVGDVVADFEANRLRRIYRSPQGRITPYRLDHRLFARAGIDPPLHLLEASRGCSFRCRFCVLPAEGADHAAYGLDAVADAIDDSIATSPRFGLRRWCPTLYFLDNNFSDDRGHMLRLCDMLREHRRVRAWGALITQNVLQDRETVLHLARSKCRALFVGVESLDREFLRRHNKKQNLSRGQDVIEDMLFAERQGILVTYPYLFDPRLATVAEMERQVAALTEVPGLPLPGFFSLISPLAGTASFWDSMAAGELRPNLLLRELDGETIAYAALRDPPERVAEFVRTMSTRPWAWVPPAKLLGMTLRRLWNARGRDVVHWYAVVLSSLRVFDTARAYRADLPRTYLGGTDRLDPQYGEHPPDISAADRETYFEPIRLTDAHGGMADWLRPYAPGAGVRRPPSGAARAPALDGMADAFAAPGGAGGGAA